MGFLKYAVKAVKRQQRNVLAQPKVKGFLGEYNVRFHLRHEKYILYNLVLGTDKKTQIDHILINSKGVFVIETKNYAGLIKGTETDFYWKQYIQGEEKEFYNPIKQNEYHINMLKERLKSIDIPYHSIIAFSKKAKLAVISKTKVIYINDLSETIQNTKSTYVSDDLQASVYEILRHYLA